MINNTVVRDTTIITRYHIAFRVCDSVIKLQRKLQNMAPAS